MGEMTLLITGAAGYVGRAAVAQARAVNHDVLAVVREPGRVPPDWAEDAGISVIDCDLRTPSAALGDAVAQADCVIHCAAAMSGDRETMVQSNVTATRALMDLMPLGGKFVHVSSIAVHDFASQEPGAILTEETPLEQAPHTRDAYAAAKLAQEEEVVSAAKAGGLELTILRPGAVFGPGQLWNAHLGRKIGPVLLRFGMRGQIPLAHISTTAEALIRAAELPEEDPIMIVDEDLPDRLRYLGALVAPVAPKLIVPLPMNLLAPVQSQATLAARYRPFGFDNTRMRDVLGIQQQKGFEKLMHEAQS
ncbi:NAD-dependent epimerase/dehydratase family protein [Primorskyibacter sp. S187A]|uniref:NAD-dependent epimerase/dehydratase family protein n=1 Tax=Primorskyibacter sp. S187A TaxID=3415130 RepID=UPI003C7EB902